MKLVTEFSIFANFTKEEVGERITSLIGEIRKFATQFENAAIFPGFINGGESDERVAIVTGTGEDVAEEADVLDKKAAICALRKILEWTSDYMQADPQDDTDKVLGHDLSHTSLKVVIEDMTGMGGTKITMVHVGNDEYEDQIYRTILILPILGSAYEETNGEQA